MQPEYSLDPTPEIKHGDSYVKKKNRCKQGDSKNKKSCRIRKICKSNQKTISLLSLSPSPLHKLGFPISPSSINFYLSIQQNIPLFFLAQQQSLSIWRIIRRFRVRLNFLPSLVVNCDNLSNIYTDV